MHARWLGAARRSLEAATSLRPANGESGRMGGFADTIERALYLLAVFDEPAAADWGSLPAGKVAQLRVRPAA